MKRKIFVVTSVILLLAMLPLRMYFIIFRTEKLPPVTNSTRSILLSQLRGEIYDCNMQKLVNRQERDIIIAMPEKSNVRILGRYLDGEDYNRLIRSVENAEPFICEGTFENENILKTRVLERYQDDGFCCHVVGYVNKTDNIGVSGIEKSFQKILTEEERKLYYTYNSTATNKMLPGGKSEITVKNYYSPKGVMLTIDSHIQRYAENAMWLYGVEKGAVVVLDSSNGEIRAMASVPVFNQNNLDESLNDESSPFLNRAVNAYCVGSVFKIVVAAAAVKEGKDDFVSYCDSGVTIGEKTFSCSNYNSHGLVDVKKAMAYSCNTYFIRLALEIGAEKLLETARNMGFGEYFYLTEGIPVSAGKLPQKDDIKTDGVLANLAFGQGGLLATPLQIAAAYASIANGGTFIQPSLIKGEVLSDGKAEISEKTQYRYRVFSKNQAERLQDILMNNFNEGTCVSSKPDYGIAGGKTSTAQTGWFDKEGNEIFHSWFAGYVEINNNNYTIVVFKENGESGGRDCGPVFKEIAERIANNH